MSNEAVVIVETGLANVASIKAGLQRSGASSRFAGSAKDIEEASHVILPGVGAFGAGMKRLLEDGYAEALVRRIEANRPTLAVCLGLQLLAQSSDETKGIEGLGVLQVHVKRFEEGILAPQFGWNFITPQNGCTLIEEGYAYFANSFHMEAAPPNTKTATAFHGYEFTAAIERGNLLGCQFHPELSGAWGLALLKRWLAR